MSGDSGEICRSLMALPCPGSSRTGLSFSRSNMKIALGLLPAAHSSGRPSALFVQQILFRLVASSRYQIFRYSKGWSGSSLVLHTANCTSYIRFECKWRHGVRTIRAPVTAKIASSAWSSGQGQNLTSYIVDSADTSIHLSSCALCRLVSLRAISYGT